MLTRFTRWLANARRYFGTRVHRPSRHHLRGVGRLEKRLTPTVFGGGVTVATDTRYGNYAGLQTAVVTQRSDR